TSSGCGTAAPCQTGSTTGRSADDPSCSEARTASAVSGERKATAASTTSAGSSAAAPCRATTSGTAACDAAAARGAAPWRKSTPWRWTRQRQMMDQLPAPKRGLRFAWSRNAPDLVLFGQHISFATAIENAYVIDQNRGRCRRLGCGLLIRPTDLRLSRIAYPISVSQSTFPCSES